MESFQAAASEIQFSSEQRAALIAALRQQNPDGPSLERLAQPGTVVVATGQQVGLFSGPAYAVYKALHAARLAEWLTANGIPAVPVFWLATEDHDFAEVDHVWVFDSEYQPRRLEMRRPASAQPAGDVTLVAPPVGELRDIVGGLPFGEEVAAMVEETYRPGATMGQAFGDLLRRLLPDRGILQVDPMLPAFRELAAPAMRAAVERAEDLTAAVLERNRQLAAAGYHAQVHVEAAHLAGLPDRERQAPGAAPQRTGIPAERTADRRRGAGRQGALAIAQRAAAAGGAGFHAAHRGHRGRPGRGGVFRAVGGDLPLDPGAHAGGRAARRVHGAGRAQPEAHGALWPDAGRFLLPARRRCGGGSPPRWRRRK